MEWIERDRQTLLKRLGGLSPQGRAAFAAACAERLLGAFSRDRNQQVITEARATLDDLWRLLDHRKSGGQREELNSLREQYGSQLSGDGDDDDLRDWLRRFAGEAVYETLQCSINGDERHAAAAASFVWSAIAAYLQEHVDADPGTSRFERLVVNGDLMTRERSAEDGDLTQLSGGSDLSVDDVDAIRRAARQNALVFFGK